MSSQINQPNYYAILNIHESATEDEIRRAYRREALQWHPDKPNGDATRFKTINEAYQVLSSPSARSQYDNALHAPQHSNHFPHSNSFHDPFMMDPFAHFNFAFRNADEVFQSVFGNHFNTMGSMSNFGLHNHQNLFEQQMGQSLGFGSFNSSFSTMSMFPSSSFSSQSTSRTRDAQGNVVEESITVDSSGKKTVTRTVNGVSQTTVSHNLPSSGHNPAGHYLTSSTRSHTTNSNSISSSTRSFHNRNNHF